MGNLQTINNLINNDYSATLTDKEIIDFKTQVVSAITNNPKLEYTNQKSLLGAALVLFNLKLNFSGIELGQAALVPYGKMVTPMIMVNGYTTLAMRSGLFKRLGVIKVVEGELIGRDEFGEPQFDFTKFDDDQKDEMEPIGFLAYFIASNGVYSKQMFLTKKQINRHLDHFSKQFKLDNEGDITIDNKAISYNDLASKTILKQLLKKWGGLSGELKTAIKYDQFENSGSGYIDNPIKSQDNLIKNSTSPTPASEEITSKIYSWMSSFVSKDGTKIWKTITESKQYLNNLVKQSGWSPYYKNWTLSEFGAIVTLIESNFNIQEQDQLKVTVDGKEVFAHDLTEKVIEEV